MQVKLLPDAVSESQLAESGSPRLLATPQSDSGLSRVSTTDTPDTNSVVVRSSVLVGSLEGVQGRVPFR